MIRLPALLAEVSSEDMIKTVSMGIQAIIVRVKDSQEPIVLEAAGLLVEKVGAEKEVKRATQQ